MEHPCITTDVYNFISICFLVLPKTFLQNVIEKKKKTPTIENTIVKTNKDIAEFDISLQLAEMRRLEGTHWIWSRIIGTPTSLCTSSYWTTLAS